MAKPKRYYWDSCVWIAYINQEMDVRGENRHAKCKAVLEKAKSGEVEIVTSAFTLAEVYKRKPTDRSGLERFPAFLEQPYVLTVPVDMLVGQRAHAMLDSGIISLKPPDAIHLVSAIRANCLEMHSFDKDILNLHDRVPVDDQRKLRICKPGEVDNSGTLLEGLDE
ncbi:MAG: hypothetical protein Salg2KO_22130 [Salibacteraceae bacterium]